MNLIRIHRLGSLITFLGAILLVIVASRFPDNVIAAFLGFAMILGGVLMRVWFDARS